MARTKFIFVFMILLGLTSFSGMAQGSVCAEIEPFCAGDETLVFPNSNEMNSNMSSGEEGPDYGCLRFQPYPAWFYLQIEDSGDLQFRISQFTMSDQSGEPLDVDFVIWGPFDRGDDLCNYDNLSGDNIIDCSYSPNAVETMEIENAIANQIYVVVITNFEEDRGYISLSQVDTEDEDQGSTDCSIIDQSLGSVVSVCGEDSYSLDGSSEEADTYQWYRYNEITEQFVIIPGANTPFLEVFEDGLYRLELFDSVTGFTENDDVEITFYDDFEVTEPPDLYACEDNPERIDLTRIIPEMAEQTANPEEYTAEFYLSLEDSETGIDIEDPENFPFEEGQEIFARLVHIESQCYSDETISFQTRSFVIPPFELAEITPVCVNPQGDLIQNIQLGNDFGDGYRYEWRSGGNIISTAAILNLQDFPQDENLELFVQHEASRCELVTSTTLERSSPPETVTVNISGSDFEDGYRIEVNTSGGFVQNTVLEYQLDDGNWRTSNIFNNVSYGRHTIRVRDSNGCGVATSDSFFLIGYPRFFTPNSDGYNDFWNLITDQSITVYGIRIFDRYGKLLKELDPNSRGWDGSFNGKDMPANDYWFHVKFEDMETNNVQEYKAHFSLLR